MADFSDLMNHWQDVCYPGLGRPFCIDNYVSDKTIWLSDQRQPGTKLKTSRNRMEAEIALRLLLNRFSSIMGDVEKLNQTMKTTADASTRKELNRKIGELTNASAEVRNQIDALDLEGD